MTIRERLAAGLVLFDGAMGTMLMEQRGALEVSQINRPLESHNITVPELVISIHRAYLEAGAQVIETNTFCANSVFLGQSGDDIDSYAVNLAGANLAREAIEQFGAGSPRYIAGAIGPVVSQGPASEEDIRSAYRVQAEALIAGGVDCLFLETFTSIEQAAWASETVDMARRITGRDIPILVSFAPTEQTASLAASQWAEACSRLTDLGADCFGVNCGGNGSTFGTVLAALYRGVQQPLIAMPSAGTPKVTSGKTSYPLSPARFAQHMMNIMASIPLCAVGGCCGTTPQHIRFLRDMFIGQGYFSRGK